MPMGLDEVRKVQNDYCKIYFFNPRYQKYISAVAITFPNMNSDLKDEALERIIPSSTLCLSVLLATEEKPSEFPDEYHGVPVFYRFSDPIRALAAAGS